MKVVVTGGCGFIGGHLVRELVNQGHDVTIIDDLSVGKKENVPKNVDFKQIDIRNFKSSVLKGADYVFHLAAKTSIPESFEKFNEYLDVNVKGTKNILDSCVENKIKKVIFISSCSVYGNNQNLPIKETTELSPLSHYAMTKVIGEQLCRIYKEKYNLDYLIFRFFNIYGPEQNPNSEYSGVISKFITKILNNDELIVFGDGKQTRDFIFVKDIAKYLVNGMKSAKNEIMKNTGGSKTVFSLGVGYDGS